MSKVRMRRPSVAVTAAATAARRAKMLLTIVVVGINVFPGDAFWSVLLDQRQRMPCHADIIYARPHQRHPRPHQAKIRTVSFSPPPGIFRLLYSTTEKNDEKVREPIPKIQKLARANDQEGTTGNGKQQGRDEVGLPQQSPNVVAPGDDRVSSHRQQSAADPSESAAAASAPPQQGGVGGPRPYPLDMVVDQAHIKRALLLAAINPSVNGVVIWGRRGTGKSVLARAIHGLLPPTIDIVRGSRYNIDPNLGLHGQGGADEFGIDSVLRGAIERGESPPLNELETETVPCPFMEIPLNVMEDALVGTVDLELSVKTGKTVFSPGLLARAHRGVLYVDEINLLDEEAANLLLNVIADGFVTVEREGLSVRYPCRPAVFVATYNPEEGELREHLLDRIGMSLSADATPLSIEERVEVVDNVLLFSGGTQRELTEGAAEREDRLRLAIAGGRDRLAGVKLTSSQVRYLCEEAIRADCEGHRAEIFAAEVARSCAAIAGRSKATPEDLRTAVMLAIAPRGRYTLDLEDTEDDDGYMSTQTSPPPPYVQEQDQPPPPEAKETEEAEQEEIEAEAEDVEEEETPPEEDLPDEPLEVPQEFMFAADRTQVDPGLMNFAKWTRRGRGGKSARIFNLERGRYIKPIFPKGNEGKIAVGATLRASAPYQKSRRRRALGTKNEGRLVYINQDDFRIKRMARKAGTLVIFLVDASGSMALNRMNAAKGAAIGLLAEAYKHRDKICLIAFRDAEAEVIVPPTKSMVLTKSRLESMPCGGGSPLAHGLTLAMRTGLNMMKVKKDVGRVVVVCITDGRANIPMYISLGDDFNAMADPASKDGMPSRQFLRDEVMVCAKQLGALPDFNFLCIDTEDKFVGTGLAKELARVAQGNYHHLIEADSKAITQVTKEGLEAARKSGAASVRHA